MTKTLLAAAAVLLCATAMASAEDVKAAPAVQDKIMKAMDANSDGKVDAAEYADFSSRMAKLQFARIDKNGDGSITAEEFGAAEMARRAAAISRMDARTEAGKPALRDLTGRGPVRAGGIDGMRPQRPEPAHILPAPANGATSVQPSPPAE